MDILLVIYILVSILVDALGQMHNKGTRDYCLVDKFTAQCQKDEVIVINSALFGRMKLNPCISRDQGPPGCFVDVKDILSGFCGGRQTCSFPISDSTFLSLRPCSRNNFDLYSTISYSCLKVHTHDDKNCRSPGVPPISSDDGYLASSVPNDSPHAVKCPWKIKSKSGRQFNVTIQRFQSSSQDKGGSNPPVCHSAAIVKEGSTVKNVLLCPSDAKNKSIYTSESDQIEVSFTNDQEQSDIVYLIHYQAIGCPAPTIPKDANYRRKGDTVLVKCNKTQMSWELQCKDNEWIGEEEDCSAVSGWAFASSVSNDEAPPMGMLLIIVTGIALGVLIGGFLLYLAINAFKRYHGLLPAQQIQNPSYEKPFYNPNKMAYNDRTIQRSSMIYGTNRRSYPNRQMPPPVPPSHTDNAQMRPPSETSEANRQSHIYETPLFNSL